MSYIFNTIFAPLGQKRAHSGKTSLDTFNSMNQNIITELETVFRTKPKELIYMFSEALEILDRNTANYMIDELAQEVKSVKEELDSTKSELDSTKKESMVKDNLIDTQKKELASKDEEIAKLKAKLEAFEKNK